MARSMRTAAEMFPLVEAYLAREQTKKAFCARHAVPESVLTYWVSKYRRDRAAERDAFLEITPISAPEDRALMEVQFPNGVRLRLFSAIAPGYLERLLTFEPSIA